MTPKGSSFASQRLPIALRRSHLWVTARLTADLAGYARESTAATWLWWREMAKEKGLLWPARKFLCFCYAVFTVQEGKIWVLLENVGRVTRHVVCDELWGSKAQTTSKVVVTLGTQTLAQLASGARFGAKCRIFGKFVWGTEGSTLPFLTASSPPPLTLLSCSLL